MEAKEKLKIFNEQSKIRFLDADIESNIAKGRMLIDEILKLSNDRDKTEFLINELTGWRYA